MRILIIGGTRFIGPHVVKQLHQKGHEIVVFHRGQTQGTLPENVKHILGDRNKLQDFSDAFGAYAPRVVLDMIPIFEQHATDVMQTFKGIADRVVAISSGDVYRAYGILLQKESGPLEPVPLSEDAPLRQKLYPYRQENAEAGDPPERWQDQYDKIPIERTIIGDPEFPGTVLRLPAVYGPGDSQHRLSDLVKRMADNRPAILLEERFARWRFSRGYVENVAEAIALAISDDRTAGKIYNVAEQESWTEAEWAAEIARMTGWQGEIVTAPGEQLPEHLVNEARWEQNLTMDSTRIRQEFGYQEQVSREDALQRAVSWERANPPEQIDPQKFDYAAEDAALAAIRNRHLAP